MAFRKIILTILAAASLAGALSVFFVDPVAAPCGGVCRHQAGSHGGGEAHDFGDD